MDTYNGFTIEQLKAAFDAMANPDDWKAPISALVKGEAVLLCVAAIEFYTGTDAQVALDVSTMTYAIESMGYRAGPAGDH